MAECDDTLRELETYLDHELTHETLQSIQTHLDGCLDCLHIFDFHAELKMVIARKCHEDALPPDLVVRIQECFGLIDLEDDSEPA